MKVLPFFFLLVVMTVNNLLHAQNFSQDQINNLVDETYKAYKEQQVYQQPFTLSLTKETEILYHHVDWLISKLKGIKNADLTQINSSLQNSRKALPNYSQQVSQYSYEIEKHKDIFKQRSFSIIEGSDISIENAQTLQNKFPDTKFKKYKLKIRMAQGIDLNEGLTPHEGSSVDVCEINFFRNLAMYNGINKPSYLKKRKAYTYTLDETWNHDDESLVKINFKPANSKQPYSGYIIINTNQKVFVEVFAEKFVDTSKNGDLIKENAKDTYQVWYSKHKNGQMLPKKVSIKEHCICDVNYNGFTKYVAETKENQSKISFKLKGKEEFESVVKRTFELTY